MFLILVEVWESVDPFLSCKRTRGKRSVNSCVYFSSFVLDLMLDQTLSKHFNFFSLDFFFFLFLGYIVDAFSSWICTVQNFDHINSLIILDLHRIRRIYDLHPLLVIIRSYSSDSWWNARHMMCEQEIWQEVCSFSLFFTALFFRIIRNWVYCSFYFLQQVWTPYRVLNTACLLLRGGNTTCSVGVSYELPKFAKLGICCVLMTTYLFHWFVPPMFRSFHEMQLMIFSREKYFQGVRQFHSQGR